MLEVKVDLLKIVLAIQLAFAGIFFLDQIGIEIPVLKQFIGLLYLLLVPGILLMLILKLNNKIELLDFILYSVGLSLSSVMFLGLILNFVGPYMGFNKPITSVPLLTTLTFFVVVCIFYIFQKKNETIIIFYLESRFFFIILVILFLPLLAAFGAYLVHYKDNNLLLLIFLIIVALVAFVPLFKQLESFYPLIIFIVSLSLIYHTVLSSPNSFGGDAYIEYGFSHLVVLKGIWNPYIIPTDDNAMLSLNILYPSFCQLCSMTVIQVYKLVYPIILSLVPLGLYSILKKQTKCEFAFFSSYFYLSVRPFFIWISEFIKQGTAMFFLVLVVLILTSKEKLNSNKSLLMLFSFSLIASHYGTSYIFMFSLIVAYVYLICRNRKLANSITYYIFLYITTAITWYIYISQASSFNAVLNIGNHIIFNIKKLFNPEVTGGLHILTHTYPVLSYRILKILYLLVNFFIVIGFLNIFYCKLTGKEEEIGEEFFSFSISSLCFLFLSVALPYFTGIDSMGFRRIYTIVLLFLAPFCIVGITKFIQRLRKYHIKKLNLKFLAIFFSIFLLFNSGWVTEVTHEYIGSTAISQARIKCCGTIKEKVALYCTYFAEEDILSAKWLSKFAVNINNTRICSDFYATRVLHTYIPKIFLGKGDPHGKELLTKNNIKNLNRNTYIYLRKLNWKDKVITKFCLEKNWIWKISYIISDLNQMNKIYSNSGSVIFLYY